MTRAPFPEGVRGPVQYGSRISAIASYLQTHHCLPEDRLALVLSDLFGLTAVPATLARLIGRTADRLQPFVKAVRDRLSGPQVEVVVLLQERRSPAEVPALSFRHFLLYLHDSR